MGSPHDYLERCSTLAIMGGTLDPIHMGHLAAAEAVLHRFNPQRVLFIPCGSPPHKQQQPITPGEHRYQMTLQAICQHPGFDVSKIEIDRPGASYTVDTIKALRSICPEDADIYFITGADAIMNIMTWKDAEELLTLCQFVAVPRPGTDTAKLTAYIKHLQKNYNAKIHRLDIPALDISGTIIRERIKNNLPVRGLLPRPAEDYALKNALYKPFPKHLSRAHFEWAKNRLRERLSRRRYHHTLGTVKEAEKLAKHYGASVTRARWAALLHDCAKEYSGGKKRALCEQWGIPLDEVLITKIDLTHSLLGAESARRDFYVTDEAILHAIRYHTTGSAKMSLLDKIIMLADYIEPYREQYYPLAQMRELAYIDIDKALILGTKATINTEKSRNNPIHRWSKEALRELKKATAKK